MKKKILPVILAILVLVGFLVVYTRQQKQSEPIRATAFKLNTIVNLTIYDSKDEEILSEAMALCDKYEKIFSRTDRESELYKLNEGTLPKEDGAYVISDELAELIEIGLDYSALSKGAFDITIDPVSSLWDFTSEEKKIPSDAELTAGVNLTGYENVKLSGNKISFQKEGMGLELGAIAKGYIADKMKEFLMDNGVKSAIIDLGGNVLCIGERPDGQPFRVGIQKPFAERSETVATAEIDGRSVVSSGVYERYFEKDGKLYHHILNPKDGKPYENNLLSVTILSDESVDGDGLSTACFALGLEKGMEFVNVMPDVQAVFVTEDGELHFSEDFEKEVTLTYKNEKRLRFSVKCNLFSFD